ncbi:MAG: CoA-acylating methylmalonate-semialdehyde dehydrogenase [Pseudomonadales bacterium]|nr:CoA-acylating methylmalonate-semialdehyde dehydrogenase [Pseudomonadales bacterium]
MSQRKKTASAQKIDPANKKHGIELGIEAQIGHLVNAEQGIQSERKQAVYNPATGKKFRTLSMASKTETEIAIAAAADAFPAWRDTSLAKRTKILFRFKTLLEQNCESIARVITEEHGKIHSDALGEVQRGIENVEYACAAPELLKGEYSKNISPGIDVWSEFQPLGVVAGITPFNFPAMVPLWMYPLAIVCGNTFVLKPSERNPSAALLIARLFHDAGLPPGVLNVVNGDKIAVNTLLADPRIEAISFVGSTPIAEHIYSTGSSNGKRVQALGGAKNHAVVMPDADLDNAVSALMGAAFGSCGERCMAISVAIAVGDDVADKLITKLKKEISQLKIGIGTDPINQMGPLISAEHLSKVSSYIEQGENEGAELLIDGRGLVVQNYEDGFFLGACLFDKVQAGMKIHSDEIFGPILCVMRVDNLQQAMQIIDAHQFGNGTCLFTRDGEAARHFSDHITVGMVGINVPLPVPVSCHSFGGWKNSLFGNLSAYGPDAVRFYTQRKTITQRWPSSNVRDGAQFSFPSNA